MRRQGLEVELVFPHARQLKRGVTIPQSAKNEDLVAMLKDVRRQIARQRNVPSYVIAPNKTLEDMARLRPTSRQAMKGVHGMGQVRLHAYGQAFIEAIRGWDSGA